MRTFGAYGWVNIHWSGAAPRLAVRHERAMPAAFAASLRDLKPSDPRSRPPGP